MFRPRYCAPRARERRAEFHFDLAGLVGGATCRHSGAARPRRLLTRAGEPDTRAKFIAQMTLDLIFNPQLRLLDGTVIRDRQDAIRFVRRQQGRSGFTQGAEIVDCLERAARPEDLEAAAHRFRSWLVGLGLLDEWGR